MNYTRPNDENYQDTPEDWLNGAMIMGRCLHLMLKENDGIVVDLHGDMTCPVDPEVKKVIVFRRDGMIHIDPCHEDWPEGDMVRIQTE